MRDKTEITRVNAEQMRRVRRLARQEKRTIYGEISYLLDKALKENKEHEIPSLTP